MENSNRLLALHILEVLNRHASKITRISQKQILYYLESEYGYQISRHTLSEYLKELRSVGLIGGVRGIYKEDYFTKREVKTLIDCIAYGKYISKQNAFELIEKLKEMPIISRMVWDDFESYMPEIVCTKNEKLYQILDVLDEAIEKNLKVVLFMTFGPNSIGEKKVLTKTVNPYYIVMSNSQYYLLCQFDRKKGMEPYRIDNIIRAELLTVKRTPLIDAAGHGFDLGKYMREHIYLYSGDTECVVFKVNTNAMGLVTDWFGDDYTILDKAQDYMTICLNVNLSAAYRWAIQFGESVEVIEPEALRSRIMLGAETIYKKYQNSR